MADDSTLFSLYLNQRYGVKFDQGTMHNKQHLFDSHNKRKTSFPYHPDSIPCDGVVNVRSRKLSRQEIRKYIIFKNAEDAHLMTGCFLKHFNEIYKQEDILPFEQFENMNFVVKGSDIIKKKPYKKKCTVNVISRNFENSDHFHNSSLQPNITIYRCQLSSKEESCCCSCNSDAMFEVMKSLYDCYKKKNCDHCNCILCGHLPKEERRLGEERKSIVALKTASAKEKAKVLKAALVEMKGKPPAEKERILKDLAMKGSPLPKGRTSSEKQLIKKVRNEIGLPPEPKTAAQKEQYKKAEVEGIITPLVGKSSTEKEKILKRQAELGLPLPEGRTPSEKAFIQKVIKTIPSEKPQQGKVDASLTPLEEKRLELNETMLRKLAGQGILLPEPKTESEKKLIDKVRKDIGLPPEPKTVIEKERQKKAADYGLLTPLEGKTLAQKERILQGQIDLGMLLPEGRTPSEKSLINKVKATKPLSKTISTMPIPSEKLRKAKAAGLITPLEGKTSDQKEKIIKGLAEHGIPLPEPKTPSEKKIISKIRKDLGLPPEPKTTTEKTKYNKALAKGLIIPLEGKTLAQKEKIIKNLVEMGIGLPEGRTLSEKVLIDKIKTTTSRLPSTVLDVPLDKLNKAKAAGFITPLEGKSPEQKDKILKGLVQHGIPLPKAKTTSEKKLIDKIRKDIGLPPEPKTPSAQEKYNTALATGLITPLEGKTYEQKEKILQGQANLGLSLPEGRSPSEKDLITKVKGAARAPSVVPIPSEKIRKAKVAGLITPLQGKTAAQKEKILRGLTQYGIPLPEPKTKSEKKILDKVRRDVGLPPEPMTASDKEKQGKALAAGILTPLEGKSLEQKEKILRGLANLDIPLPEGRTPSEKALIGKVQALARPSAALRIPSEKMRKAKAAGLITPLSGKTPEQKEKILRELAAYDIPLPEGKTPSENKAIEKVRKDIGLPPKPKSSSAKEKYNKALAAGLITPLEGKTAAQKEKILKRQADFGLQLPEGRTSSEKSLIDKVKASAKAPSVVLIPSEKLRKAKAAGIITPLTGKTPDQKEKILKGLVAHGIPLPDGKTTSEKKIIHMVRKDLGLPPEPKTRSAKEKYDRALAAGLITPLEGKTIAQKEKILQGQANIGLPLPEGRTSSEKAIISKVKTRARIAERSASLPSAQRKRLDEKTAKIMKEGKGPSDECICPQLTLETDRVSKLAQVSKEPGKITSEKFIAAKAGGVLTPLAGKTLEQKERIVKELLKHGLPLPEAKTISEKKLVDKVRVDLGLPPEPFTSLSKEKYDKARAAGLVTPLKGKSVAQKEKILREQAKLGLSLPEGRTPSEKALIAKVHATTRPPSVIPIPSEKLRKAKAAGLITPLQGKTIKQKEKILRGLADHRIPLPEPTSTSERKLIDKVRKDMGFPPEPRTAQEKEKYQRAAAAGLISPLEGKTSLQKKRILQGQFNLGLPLPEGRTQSEKALIARVKASATTSVTPIPSEKLRKAKAAGLITPLTGKTSEQKEKIMKGLVAHGIPLPEGKTVSEIKLIAKIRKDMALPPEPKTPSAKEKYKMASAAGLITPLEGKSTAQKQEILQGQADLGLALPEGRTASEKALIAKVKARAVSVMPIPPEKLHKAKAAGLITPLAGKSPEQKEKIIKGLAAHGIPLPEPRTASEKKIIDKVRNDIGLPPEPKTKSAKEKYNNALAAGIVTPLEGKTATQKEQILKDQANLGITLPEGRTPSEKAIIAKVKAIARPPSTVVTSEKIRKAKAAGLITPISGKTPEQKEIIFKGLAELGLPLPEPTTPSEKRLLDKLHAEVKPTTSGKLRHAKATGLLTPLEGKTLQQKTKILRNLIKIGLPLPEPKTSSEKELVRKLRDEVGLPPEPKTPSMREKYDKLQVTGIITPLEGKTLAQKEKILKRMAEEHVLLPKGRTSSEKELIAKVQAEVGTKLSKSISDVHHAALPPDDFRKLDSKTAKVMKEGKGPSDECICSLLTPVSERVSQKAKSVPSGIPSEKIRRAKAAGLITPLDGKSMEQKEKILRGLALHGIPLPEPKTATDKKLTDKIQKSLGLPPAPKSAAETDKHKKAAAAGLLTPLEGKSLEQKEKILLGQDDLGLSLPEGRTPSEKALIAKIKASPKIPSGIRISSEKLRKAKAAGLITPLEGKTSEQKEKILRGLAQHGIPLPEPKSASDSKITKKVRKDLGLPPEPNTTDEKVKYNKALVTGIITPLEGKTLAQKEKVLTKQAEMGIPLPEGRTVSEKVLIDRIKNTTKRLSSSFLVVPSDKLEKAKAAGLITPLEGKTSQQKEKILRGLIEHGIPLPELKTASEVKLTNKVRKDLGLPPEPKTIEEKEKYNKALIKGIITPLDGKTNAQKEKVLRKQAELGIPMPEGRTSSEKALIEKVRFTTKRLPSVVLDVPSDILKKAKKAGLLSPLKGKTEEQQEKILRGLVQHRIMWPEAKNSSERNVMNKVRKDLGLPPEPKTAAYKTIYNKALTKGLITPLEGKTPVQKEKVLRDLVEMGIPLPEGRTSSEKALINHVKTTTKKLPTAILDVPLETLKKAKAAGLITPLEGKTPQQKEKIFRGLAVHGIPIPEAKTASEKKIIDKVRKDLGLPPEPKTTTELEKYRKATAAGLITPLEGKTPLQQEQILQGQADLGMALPEGRTPSEKALIAKVEASTRAPSTLLITSQKLRNAKASGLLTPLEGKTSEQKEKILHGLARHGIPLPETKTASEGKIISKVRRDLGLPPEPKTAADKAKYNKAFAKGLITPLEGKTSAQKEKVLRDQAELGIPLPEGRTPSEKILINNVKATTRKVPSAILDVPIDKLKKAKAAGLITPLEGKSAEQQEIILRGLAQHGIPIPAPKTASEKKIIDKIRKDLGLPPEPKSIVEQEKYKTATAAGLLTPLEGKTTTQKEKILQGLANLDIPLPEGRTSSEKALIAKVKTSNRAPSAAPIPSEKMYKAKVAGLLTPLEGKTSEQKEKILRGLAEHGIPLPETKTASEKKIISKIRRDLGLPPEPKTAAETIKYNKALAKGLITPLEGKTTSQKEKVLRDQAELGIPLPVGRTISEKALIDNVKATTKKVPTAVLDVPLDKFKKAKAAGFITPLEGKPPKQKEKILRGLAEHGIPIPEPKTLSDKKIMEKIRKDLGLPPEPKTTVEKEKYRKATAAGLLTPLEGKTAEQKEQILQGQADLGMVLPEGRTPSEKALIAKVEASTRAPSTLLITSQKLRNAKAAGLLTPLEGKTSEQKEKILRGLARHGIPLPETKTASERKIMHKVVKDLGLPPEPKTAVEKVKYNEALRKGIITPLEGKTFAQKKKVLRDQAKMGIHLPEGRTPSEKALIAKLQAEGGARLSGQKISYDSPSLPTEKARKLDLKTAKVIKEGKGPSDECICPLLTPKSERQLKTKVKPFYIPSEKIRKAKAAGLLTPLKGKTSEQKEQILRGLAQHGISLPEPKSVSEEKLLEKVRKDLGFPPEPKTLSAKEKYDNAMALGLITPLEGKTPTQKEKILKKQMEIDLPLPVGRTPSEKALIDKVKAALKTKSVISSQKLQRANVAGLLTPLEGKSSKQKKKILTGTDQGLSLPEGKTQSEKSLIHKIRSELGIPPSAKTHSKKEVIKKAKAEGLLTPLAGKTDAEKEKILKGLADAGLPMPVGQTLSEKELIRKVRTAVRYPLTATSSENLEKIKTKSKQVGAMPLRKSAKTIAVSVRPPPPGVTQEFEDIVRTTTCDRGCGCDKKKIRFKHSYVKIRVTSPDISSFCPCPEDCVPGVKGGIFTDNEGIKVTVGRIIGVPSYTAVSNTEIKQNKLELLKIIQRNIYVNKLTAVNVENTDKIGDARKSTIRDHVHSNATSTGDKYGYEYVIFSTSGSEEILPHDHYSNETKRLYSNIYVCGSHSKISINEDNNDTVDYYTSTSFSVDSSSLSLSSLKSRENPYLALSTTSSIESILIIKTESSLSLTTNSYLKSDTSLSVISFLDSNFSSNVSHYLVSKNSMTCTIRNSGLYKKEFVDEEKYSKNNNYFSIESKKSEYSSLYTCSMEMCETQNNMYRKYLSRVKNMAALLGSSYGEKEVSKLQLKDSSVVITYNINKDKDTMELVHEFMEEKRAGARATKKPCTFDEKRESIKICKDPNLPYKSKLEPELQLQIKSKSQNGLTQAVDQCEFGNEHFNDIEWIFIKEIKKMKSELTQTTAEFAMKVV